MAKSAPLPAAPLSPTAAVKTPTVPASGNLPDSVSLPLGTVVAGLAPEFQNLFAAGSHANVEVQFPLQAILPQLSSGRVRVAFGDLRKACPNGSCKAGPEHDAKLIDLPLANILSRLSPALLPRRTQRQLMDVPKDVTGLFGSIGDPIVGGATAATAPSTPAPAPAAPPKPKPQPAAPPVEQTEPAKPISMPATAGASPAPPARRKSAVPDDLESIPSLFAAPKAAPAGEPTSKTADSISHEGVEQEVEPAEPPKIKFNPASFGLPAGPAAVKPAAPSKVAPVAAPTPAMPHVVRLPVESDENNINIAIKDLMESWPQPVLDEVRQYHLEEAQLSLPAGEVDRAMRKGKIVFKWKVLRGWVAPAGGAPASTACDDADITLPLKTIAPLFLALRQPKGRQRKAHVEESIPDLFSGGPAPAEPAAPASAPTPAADHSGAAPVAARAEVAEAGPVAEPAAKPAGISAANPNELVTRTAKLKGVTGALLAMSDGLVVASALPAPLHGETVAAFLPQIFGRLTQFSNELKLGELSSVMLVMDNCPWIIFRTGKVYFAVMGKQAEALPLPQLTAIVADIKRQNI
ncbi:MAG TPA: hypothetical protein DCY13_04040 [Verrucomicrobiales bacterium]|nr:hypothetical protein [Verrucomicrobiales bacterium]